MEELYFEATLNYSPVRGLFSSITYGIRPSAFCTARQRFINTLEYLNQYPLELFLNYKVHAERDITGRPYTIYIYLYMNPIVRSTVVWGR